MDNLCMMDDLDVIYTDDDISICSFDDATLFAAAQDTEAQQSEDPISGKAVNQDEAAPDIGEDWNYSNVTTTFSNMSSQPSSELVPKESGQKHPSSIEGMIFKLNKTMLKSARTRAMVSKTVYPDLKRKGYALKGKKRPASLPTSKTTTAHKAKHTCYKKEHSGDSFSAEIRQDNSICKFLRESKRW